MDKKSVIRELAVRQLEKRYKYFQMNHHANFFVHLEQAHIFDQSTPVFLDASKTERNSVILSHSLLICKTLFPFFNHAMLRDFLIFSVMGHSQSSCACCVFVE